MIFMEYNALAGWSTCWPKPLTKWNYAWLPWLEFNNPSALGEGADWRGSHFETAPIMSHQIPATLGGQNLLTPFLPTILPRMASWEVLSQFSGYESDSTTRKTKDWLTLGSNLAFTLEKKKWPDRKQSIQLNPSEPLNMDPVTLCIKLMAIFCPPQRYADTDIANPKSTVATRHTNGPVIDW